MNIFCGRSFLIGQFESQKNVGTPALGHIATKAPPPRQPLERAMTLREELVGAQAY